MNKTIFVLVPLCCFLAACAANEPPAQSASFIPNCPEIPDRPCPGPSNKIRLVVSATGIDPRPSRVCVDVGDEGATIEVEVVGIPTDSVVVATVPKDADNGWILNARSGEGTMSIVVPAGTPTGDYGYFAMSSTGKCVDPIIHVN